MSHRSFVAAAVSLSVVLAASGCGSPAPADALANVDWKDHVRSCAKEEGGSGLGTVIGSVIKGDVNGDGRVDTAVVNECGSSTSRWPQVVEVFDGASEPQNPQRLGVLLEGDTDYMRDLSVAVESGGRIVIDGLGLSSDAALCCPDVKLHKVFVWSEGTFTLAERRAEPRPTPS